MWFLTHYATVNGIFLSLLKANNEAGGAAGDAGQGGGGEENPNNAEEHVAEEENMANQDVGNAAHNGEGQ